MAIESYFFDTYALIEIIGGNPNYLKYTDFKIVTTKLNLLELYSHLLRNHDEKTADHYYGLYLQSCIMLNDSIIKESVKMWISMRKIKKKPSYIDCIGYILAKNLNIKFLTGDKEFKELPNVEFVK